MQMIYEQNSFVNLLKSKQVPFVILKGTSAAVYFKNPFLRTFGDIDLYIYREHLDLTRNILENNGYIFIKTDNNEYVYEKNGISFELHLKLSGKYYNDVEEMFKNGLSHAVQYKISDFTFPGLPTYENGISLLGHIMHHLKTYGIGLRQIIDWMMFVHREIDDLAWEKSFRALAAEAGLEKLAITVTYVCKKWLGLPDDITWCKTADENVAKQLLLRILNDGNFGCDRAPYENIRKKINSEGLFTHLQNSGISNWHLAQKNRIFRPFAWLYQICRYVCLGFAGLLFGKSVFGKNKQILNIEDLLEKLE